MDGSNTGRTRYPHKLSVIGITKSLHRRMTAVKKKRPELSEAEIVRAALEAYLPPDDENEKGDE